MVWPIGKRNFFYKINQIRIMNSKTKKFYPVRNSPPQRPFGRASAGAISNEIYLIGLVFFLAGLFLINASSALAAGCQEKTKELSFFSAFNPFISFAEKTIKGFGYDIALAETPPTDPGNNPDNCGEDIVFCAGDGTAGVTITWDVVPYSEDPSSCAYFLYINFSYYILTVPGTECDSGCNTGFYNGYTISSGLISGNTYPWSVVGYCGCGGWNWRLDELGGCTPFGMPSGSFTALNCADFSISVAPASATVGQGGAVDYTVTVQSLGGFNSNVNLSLDPGVCPTGADCDFSSPDKGKVTPPANGSATSTLTIQTTGGTPPSPYNNRYVAGKSGPLSHNSNNFSLIVAAPPNQPPSANNLLATQTPNYCVSGPTAIFSWAFTDPDIGDTSFAYQIQVDNNSDFSSPEVDSCKIINPGNSYSIGVCCPGSPCSITYGNQYYWRLRVWDSKDATSTDWIYPPSSPGSPTPSPGTSFTTPSHAYPSPNFFPSPQNPAIAEVVTFIDSSKCYSSPGNTEYSCSAGGSISYLWDFDNGQTSTKKGNATTTYTTTGPKTVRLTITDNSLTPAGSCPTTMPVNTSLSLPDWIEIPPF